PATFSDQPAEKTMSLPELSPRAWSAGHNCELTSWRTRMVSGRQPLPGYARLASLPGMLGHGHRRRSTRVAHAVFLTVTGIHGEGQPFVEEMATLELSLHGCRYFSKYDVPKNSCLVLELPNPQAGSRPRRFRGRVA